MGLRATRNSSLATAAATAANAAASRAVLTGRRHANTASSTAESAQAVAAAERVRQPIYCLDQQQEWDDGCVGPVEQDWLLSAARQDARLPFLGVSIDDRDP